MKLSRKQRFVETSILLYILLLIGCTNQNNSSDGYSLLLEQYNLVTNRLYDKMIDDSDWFCTKYANKTSIHPEYFENCCINFDYELLSGEKSEYEMVIDDVDKLNLKLSNKQNDTLYKGGRICFDASKNYTSIGIDNQTINMAICASTLKRIKTNETICVAKERRSW